MSGEQAVVLSADERIAAVLLAHPEASFGAGWPGSPNRQDPRNIRPICRGCKVRLTEDYPGPAEVAAAFRLHVAAALRAEWEAQANTDRAAVESPIRCPECAAPMSAEDAGMDADHAAELRAATSAGYIRGYGKASADAAQVARVVAAAREAGL